MHLFDQSIWGRGAIPAEALVYRRSRRLYLPITYLLIALGGAVAAINGIPTIDTLFDRVTGDVVSTVFALSGIGAFVGEAWPRLRKIELWSLVMQTGLLTAYATALFVRAFSEPSEHGGPGFVGVLALLVIMLPLIRIDVLAVEDRIRRALQRLDKEEPDS